MPLALEKSMARAQHPKKEIEVALRHAESRGWRIEAAKGRGHAWGRIYCSHHDSACRAGEFCVISIYCTPRSPSNHATRIRRIVDNCLHRYEILAPVELTEKPPPWNTRSP
ncbi:conserved hypothetical protein [Cupriavidus neocaledonicus]|uniref:Uncharacterized protein n=2 Tax=Cupriavidus neocaledonicus TaxID=1040979 RepID=A0ABY1V0X4_9BURK|nr:conserved hypothetical protein [Cupriavidus neocaledonicus]